MAGSSDERYWIGFDLGGTKMLAVVYDDQFQQVARRRKKTNGHEGAKAGLKRMAQTIREALDKADIETGQVGGIGVGCAGPLDLDRGIIHEAPNLAWRDVHVKEVLEEDLGTPVVVVNDVDAGVFGEYCFGAGQGARCVVGVFPGTGIGGGCVYQGQILRGQHGSCMEIGHMQVVPEGPLCGCGHRGCLEAVASRLAISGAAAQAAHRGYAPHLRKIAGTDISDIRSGALAEAVRAGDQVVEQIVREAARCIGVALASVVHLLAPDTVVLGGGLVEAMPELFVDTVHRAARQRVLPAFAELFSVKAARLGDDATVLGAAAWAGTCLGHPPVRER